jgi:hypothetical protein
LLATPEVVMLPGAPPLRRRDVMRRGTVTVPVRTETLRWRTRSAADAEGRLAEVARRGVGAGLGRAPVPSQTPSDRDASEALRSLLGSGRAVELVESGGGWRRDWVLSAAGRAWSESGLRVMVGAEGRAAADIQSATGMVISDHRNLVEGLTRLRVGGPGVVILAGAEATPAQLLADLAEATGRLGAKLVLVGEPGPFPEVDRAGGWRAAHQAIGSLRLGREAPALESLARADEVLRPAPWLVLAAGPDEVRHRLVADWLESPAEAAMVASRRPDIDELNRRARSALLAQGRLGTEVRAPGQLVPEGARHSDRLLVGRADAAARRGGLVPGAVLHLDGDQLVSASGSRWSVEGLDGEVDLRFGYARTPYQAWRAGASPLLVLGRPPTDRPRPEQSCYYTVGSSRTRAAEYTFDPSRTRAADYTVDPSRTRAAERGAAEGAWLAGDYERSRPTERARERSLGRG